MRTQKELVASLHERMAARERARAHRRVQALRAAAVAVAACLLLVIYGGGVARQGGTAGLYSGATLFFENAGAYVLVALLAFMAGAAVTVVCIRRQRKARDEETEKTEEAEED